MGKCSKNIATKPQNHGFEKMRCRGHSTKWCLLARLQEHKTPPPKLKKSPGQKQKTSIQTHKKPRPKTKNLHSNPQKAQAKNKKLTQTHKKASLPPRPKPHHFMNCERAVRHCRAALSQFGGVGGLVPPQKNKKLMGTGPPTKKAKLVNCCQSW